MSYQEIQGHSQVPQQNADKWLRRLLWAAKGFLVFLVVAAIALGFRQPLDEQQALRNKVTGLSMQRDQLRAERDRLLRRLNWIQTDVGYLELEVRDRLNLQKRGEFVLRFED